MRFAEVRLEAASEPGGGSEIAGRDDRARGECAGGRSGGAGVAELTAMLAFPAAIRIYVAVEPVDMRKRYEARNAVILRL